MSAPHRTSNAVACALACALAARGARGDVAARVVPTEPAATRSSAPPAGPSSGLDASSLPRSRSARFAWVRAAGAEQCPDERSIARSVAQRLGRRPFSEGSARSLEAIVSREGDSFVARIYLRDERGTPLGERVLQSDPGDCASLAGPATLAVALAIDPEATLRPAPGANEPAPPPAPEPAACPPERACPAPATPEERIHADTPELRVSVEAGLLPHAAPGVSLSMAAVAYRRFSLRTGAQWFPEVRTDDGRFGFGLLSLRFAGCGRPASLERFVLDLCGGFHVGALHAVVYRPIPTEPGDRAWGALGADAQAAVRVAGPVWAVLTTELVVPLVRHEFMLEGSTGLIFQQSPAAFVGGLGLALSFL